MSETLLHTKLYAPALRTKLVARPRLVARLSAGLDLGRRVTLVSAPAGFGKTTLVLSWLAELRSENSPRSSQNKARKFCWLSLDEEDDDLVRLLSYLIAAVQTAFPDFGQGLLAHLRAMQSPGAAEMTRPFLNELATLPVPLLIVLDDYHAITQPPVQRAMEIIIDYLPPHCHVVLTSRDEPALPLPRWRVRNLLTHISAPDLRFRRDEVSAFLQQTMGLDLSQTAVAALEERTEGWVAGLQLAALSLRHAADPDAQVEAFSGSERLVADYLLSEVLAQRQSTVRDFLLRTSVLPRFNASLCNHLLLQENGHEILDRLEKMNLFLIPLDNRRGWYRYHHLFAQLLQDRLRQQLDETVVAGLHRRAARWFAAQSLFEEAIQHALQAEELDYAAGLLAALPAQTLWHQGGSGLIRQWGQVLPLPVLRAHPRSVFLIAAAYLMVGDFLQLNIYLEIMADEESTRGYYLLLRAIVDRNNDRVQEALAKIEAALPLLADANEATKVIAELQLVNIYYAMGKLNSAETAISQVSNRLAMSGTNNDLGTWLQVQNMKILLAWNRGDLVRAEQICREGIEQVDRQERGIIPMVGLMYSGLGDLFYEWNDIDRAAAWYEKAMYFAQRTYISDLFITAYLGMANVALARGEEMEVAEIVQEVRRYVRRSGLEELMANVETIGASYQWQLGNLEAAVRWANATGFRLDDQPAHPRLASYRLLAAIRLSESRARNETDLPPQILSLVEKLEGKALATGNKVLAIEALTLQALAQDLLGDGAAARAALVEALALARPGSFVRIFLKYGSPLQKLLQRASPADPGYLRHLQEAFVAALGTSLPSSPSVQLTGREMDVLAALAEGLSNKGIAAKLVVSNNTVRTHLKNLYSKLEVSSRTEALKRAGELGLI